MAHLGLSCVCVGTKAQSGKSPKWDPKARVGIYLGHSPCHAGSVALVLNPRTLHVSPQYHVVFDDNFSTVPYMRTGEIPDHWSKLVEDNSESTTDKQFELANIWAQEAIEEDDTSLILTKSYPPSSPKTLVNEGASVNEGKLKLNNILHQPMHQNLNKLHGKIKQTCFNHPKYFLKILI